MHLNFSILTKPNKNAINRMHNLQSNLHELQLFAIDVINISSCIQFVLSHLTALIIKSFTEKYEGKYVHIPKVEEKFM